MTPESAHDGQRQSGLEQTRALVTSNWIASNGSLKARSPSGQTFQENLQLAEGAYARRFAERQAARRQPQPSRQLPAPPPAVRQGSSVPPVTIDLDGIPIR